MGRILVAVALALAFGALLAGVALANGGPHGNYGTGLTAACAACHRAHTAVSEDYLLKRATPYEVCISCHDGTGVRLDVLDGVRLSSSWAGGIREPGVITGTDTITGTLNGGGFEYVNGQPVTSKHNVKTSAADPGQFQPWGMNTDPGSLLGTLDSALTCTSCHDPHGSKNYRIIQERVNDKVVSVLAYYNGAFTSGESSPTPDDKYRKEYYGSAGLAESGGHNPDGTLATAAGDPALNGMTLLCGACHTSYPSSGADDATYSKHRHRTEMPYDVWLSPRTGDPVACQPEVGPTFNPTTRACDDTMPKLRLASDGTNNDKIVTCTTCHYAHGTAATMSSHALLNTLGGSSRDEVSPAQTADSKSTLLYLNNRGVCEACHQW